MGVRQSITEGDTLGSGIRLGSYEGEGETDSTSNTGFSRSVHRAKGRASAEDAWRSVVLLEGSSDAGAAYIRASKMPLIGQSCTCCRRF